MNIYILDTEVNSLEHRECIELGYIKLDKNYNPIRSYNKLFSAKNDVSFGAMAVHNILPEYLESLPLFSKDKIFPIDYLIGHNIDFDWEVIGKPDCKRICTLAIARELLPKIDSHTLAALTYYFSTNREKTKTDLKQAHSAAADCKFTLSLLSNLIKLSFDKVPSIEELYIFSELCRIPKIMTFGKYKGYLIKDLPLSYKQWLLNQPDLDKYFKEALTKTN